MGNRRFHVHSFGNLIHADFRVPSYDYLDLLKVTHLLTRTHGEVLKAFRLAAFNVLAHNRDDHAKNFAFILDEVRQAVARWPEFAKTAGLTPSRTRAIGRILSAPSD